MQPAVPPARGGYDEIMTGDGVPSSPGFTKRCPVWPFANGGSCGAPGAGGFPPEAF
jgi:hypothetical protein